MRNRFILVCIAAALLIFAASCTRTGVEDYLGLWTLHVSMPSGDRAECRLEVVRSGRDVSGALINGDERTEATGGALDGGRLKLRFDYYDGELDVELKNGELHGVFTRQWRKERLRRGVHGVRYVANPGAAAAAPFLGEWILRVGEGESARHWRASFREQDGEMRGTVIPLSGDWGTLAGRVENGELLLGRFDGINVRTVKLKAGADGILGGTVDLGGRDGARKVVAERPAEGNTAALADPSTATRVKNPAEPFRFAFPDVSGRMVSSADERFRGKVIIASISGTWCPNCYDEGPFLQELYDRYRTEGLEVVVLAFEYTGDAARDGEQLRIFGERLGLTYPLLLAGTTDEGDVDRKLPQLENFSVYPTTIFIGRDGLVKRIHAGFEGRAAGERFTRLKSEIEELVRELLSER
ncbi:MAG: TlpA family protein disulfide reductase [Acidobacteria bacterium]|nr:TlpA family protein disulfide reductase [Acidobacteriota bacterium]